MFGRKVGGRRSSYGAGVSTGFVEVLVDAGRWRLQIVQFKASGQRVEGLQRSR
jgi:hypothetical protein